MGADSAAVDLEKGINESGESQLAGHVESEVQPDTASGKKQRSPDVRFQEKLPTRVEFSQKTDNNYLGLPPNLQPLISDTEVARPLQEPSAGDVAYNENQQTYLGLSPNLQPLESHKGLPNLPPGTSAPLHDYEDLCALRRYLQWIARSSKPYSRSIVRETVEKLSDILIEPHYSEAPDALALLDLSPQSLGVEPDSIRVLLSKTLPTFAASRNVTEFWKQDPSPPVKKEYVGENYEDRKPGESGTRELFPGRPFAIRISSSIDTIARIIVALLVGSFLLVPMVALSYIKSKEYCLVTTCSFVVVFAVVLSLASRASNQEVITTTATYAAVLVVFVGQTSVPSGGT